MINVYVDDFRDCSIGFVVARTFQEAIHLLENHEVDIPSLDHDLGEDLQGNLLPTGYDLNHLLRMTQKLSIEYNQ